MNGTDEFQAECEGKFMCETLWNGAFATQGKSASETGFDDAWLGGLRQTVADIADDETLPDPVRNVAITRAATESAAARKAELDAAKSMNDTLARAEKKFRAAGGSSMEWIAEKAGVRRALLIAAATKPVDRPQCVVTGRF